MAREYLADRRKRWERTRWSVFIPIGAIIAVAILCIVVAVLTSARRADEVSLEQEAQLLMKELANRSEWSLRKLEGATRPFVDQPDTPNPIDSAWIQERVQLALKTLLDYEYVSVADALGRQAYTPIIDSDEALHWRDGTLPDLAPTLEYLHGLSGGILVSATRLPSANQSGAVHRAAFLQNFRGRPAIVSAVIIASDRAATDIVTSPVLLAVKYLDRDLLAEAAARLHLNDLHTITAGASLSGGHEMPLLDDLGHPIVRFVWTPKRPGTEIIASVIPFIIIAFGGFALLVAVIVGYMRRTAATIAAGETRLRHLALHDPLCGLPNRICFGERLETVIAAVKRGGPPAAVFYIDLDHFKEVNDTLGHPVGDELIRNVTLRLSNTVRGDDLVARLGGDEFAVITTTASDNASLQSIATRLIAKLCAPYSVNGQTIVIGASIGIAVIDRRSGAAADIMRYADMALYRAKNEGRNRACIYDAVMDADLSHRKLLENDLRQAIENNGLNLVYQPLVNSSGEKIVGVEALCRWRHPERGEISPVEFIPIAEHSGLIIDLGEWVLRRACLDGQGWPNLTVAVNVSPLQFRRADFVDVVERILKETGFDPSRLELEVTESTLLGNVDTAEAAMLRLKALGVRLALDDFGTGYSSLLYLRRFPFDKLKIDSSFVRSIEKAADAAAIVHAVVSLGRGLGMKVTAEGVETAEQHLFLRAAGVHCMQGFRFGRPMPVVELTARIAAPIVLRPFDGDIIAAMAS